MVATSSRRIKATETGQRGGYDLSTRALLANIEVHTWGGRGMDKKAGNEIAQKYGLGDQVGRYVKWLLIQDEAGHPPRELVAVHNAGNTIRTVHNAHTLPWDSDGPRILTAANFLPWASAVRDKQLAFQDAAGALVDVYPELKEATREIMEHKRPGLYHEADYPSQDELFKRFAIRIKHGPLPVVEDFRAELAAPQVEAISQQIQRDFQASIGDTTTHILKLMADMAERVAKLGNPKGGVRTALADDVADLCGLVSRLNFTGDPKIEEFRKRVEDELTFDPGVVKRMRGVRTALAQRAEKVHDDLAAYMGA